MAIFCGVYVIVGIVFIVINTVFVTNDPVFHWLQFIAAMGAEAACFVVIALLNKIVIPHPTKVISHVLLGHRSLSSTTSANTVTRK